MRLLFKKYDHIQNKGIESVISYENYTLPKISNNKYSLTDYIQYNNSSINDYVSYGKYNKYRLKHCSKHTGTVYTSSEDVDGMKFYNTGKTNKMSNRYNYGYMRLC